MSLPYVTPAMNHSPPPARDRKLAVLLINKFLFPFGGVESVVFGEKALLEARGHRVILFGMHHPRNIDTPWARYFVSQVDYADSSLASRVRSALRTLYSVEARRKIRRLIADTKPDIAHVHHIYHQITPSILYELRAAGIPIVQTIHDYKPVCPNAKLYVPTTGELCFRCKGNRFYHAALTNCGSYGRGSSVMIALEAYLNRMTGVYLRHVGRFLTPSHFLRDKLIEGGMPAERIHVARNFVDIDEYQPVDGGRYVLFAGRLEVYKGVLNVLEAARRLPDVPFHIAGAGRLEAEVRRVAAALPNVTVTGHLDRLAVRREIEGAICLVAPSLWNDIAPQVVLEAFACGKPAICSARGGFVEMIQNGVNGYLLENDDPAVLTQRIADLCFHPTTQAAMGRAARAVAVTAFSPDRHYETLMSVYAPSISI
ncbi:MAG: glycosyltransferase [Aggregatilineales bacterium]